MPYRSKPRFTRDQILLHLFFALLGVKLIIACNISNALIRTTNFGIDAFIFLLLIGSAFSQTPKSGWPRGLVLLLLLLSALVALSDLFSGNSFRKFFLDFPKLVVPWICFYFLDRQLVRNPSALVRLTGFTTILVVILILVGFALLPRPLNKFYYWMPAYFSGLHKSAYVLLNVAFLLFALHHRQWIDMRLFVTCYVLLGLLLFWGWGVRSATLCLLIFPLVYFYFTSRLMKQVVFLAMPVVLVAVLLYVVLASKLPSYHDLSNLSSGRLEMWQLKLKLIANASVKDFLLGRGSGSDFILSDVWWWARKDSHNDYMRIFYQYGLLGFVSYLLFVYHFYRTFAARNLLFTTFLVSYLFSGLLSNGLFFRALPNYIFAIALAATFFPARHGLPNQLTLDGERGRPSPPQPAPAPRPCIGAASADDTGTAAV